MINLPLTQLHDTLLNIFDISPQMNDSTLIKIFYERVNIVDSLYVIQAIFHPESFDKPIFGRDYFKNKTTYNDIFITTMAAYWPSTVYFDNDKPFNFATPFALQLKKISNESTLLAVKALTPVITNGTLCCGPHGTYSRLDSVQPTTVEEYALILYITKKLGLNDLKPLNIPL